MFSVYALSLLVSFSNVLCLVAHMPLQGCGHVCGNGSNHVLGHAHVNIYFQKHHHTIRGAVPCSLDSICFSSLSSFVFCLYVAKYKLVFVRFSQFHPCTFELVLFHRFVVLFLHT
jgi:hypothetical protein